MIPRAHISFRRPRAPRWPAPSPPVGGRGPTVAAGRTKLNKPPRRTRDLLAATAVSAAVFSCLLFGFDQPTAPVQHAQAMADDTVQIEMPPLAQELPDTAKVEDPPPEEDVSPALFAPPSLVDIPTVVPDATFVESVTPPPPPGIEPAKGIMTIPPTGRPGFGRGMGAIFDLGQLDAVPVVRFQQQPIYPPAMLRADIAGEVKVAFIVDTNGNVRDAYVVSSTREDFDAAAVLAVSKWKFRPGRKNGQAVNTRMSVPIGFQMGE